MKYSIIVATYNRLDELKELFASVENLDFSAADFEFVISDDGSNDGTADFISSLKTVVPFQIQYLFQQNKGPGAARNAAMEKADGDYFIFIDSDVMLPPEWLRTIDEFLKNTPLDAFGGPDTCHESFSPLLKAINYSMTSFIGTGGTRGSKKSVQKKFYPRSFNMGVSRKVWEAVGSMGALRHGQDMEYSARIYKNGFIVGLIPDAFVYHKRRTSLKRFYKQIFNWGVARINLGRMDKTMLKPIHLIPAAIVAAFLVLIAATPLFYFAVSQLFIFVLYLWIAVGVFLLLLAGIAFLQSITQYKKLKIGFLSIVTLYIQIFAYGFGLWKGILQVLTGKKEAKGFTRNYYK
jgi:glycosyltransferase involved in cell wall biosynthesis